MAFKQLTEHHLEFLSLKGGCTGSSESTHAKIPHCWKSYVGTQFLRLLHKLKIWSSCSVYNTKSTWYALKTGCVFNRLNMVLFSSHLIYGQGSLQLERSSSKHYGMIDI